MKRWPGWLGLVLGALLLAAAVLWWQRDRVLQVVAAAVIERATGMRTEIAGYEGNHRWDAGAVSLRGVRLHNFPEFGGGLLLDLPELVVELDPAVAAAGKVRFRQLRMHLAELHVIQDAEGRWNFERVEREMTERNAARTNRHEPRLTFGGIDSLSLTLDRVRYTDLRRPDRSREFRVGVTNEVVTGIQTEEQLQEWLGSFLFRTLLNQVAAREQEPRPRPQSKSKAKDALKDALEGPR
ncbi:MAG: hypothetical protein RJA22_895 [Verrucomicrobiota bacterium]|jgi:hypothetical protein